MSLHISLWVTLLLSVLAAVANVSTQLSAAQTSAARLRSQVTLDFRSAAVSVLPLPADDPAHQPLLSATADGRVRVAQIEIGAPFELGGIELELPTPVGGRPSPVTRYDMWLATASDHWTIVLALAEGDEASEPIDVVGTFRVAHDTHDATTATLTGGLIATGGDGARLMLQWGCHVWTADGQFMPLRRPSFAGGGGREPPQAEPRSRDWDSSGVRRLGMLGTRNEVAVTLLDGSRLATVYPKDLKVEDRDFAHLVSVASGAVVRVTAGAATKLEMDVRLQFGDLTLETGNVGLEGTPGVYGVWLKRVGDGWRLVFNDEPDVWGIQHDPTFDVGEVELAYTQADDSSRAMSASVVMITPDQGRFVLVWGPHEWTADFSVAR